MKTKYLVILIALALVLISGCQSVLVHEGGPDIKRSAFLIDECGQANAVYGQMIVGTIATVVVEFETSNVNQEFDAVALIDSPLVPYELQPNLSEVYTFSTASTKPGGAKGTKRVSFNVDCGCFSSGMYELSVVITDASGKSDTYHLGFEVILSPKTGSSPCKCISYCGACKAILSTLFIRCFECSCPYGNDDCKTV